MFSSTHSISSMPKYALVRDPCPIFNTQQSPFSHHQIQLDSQGRIFAMETIAFPETVLTIHQQLSDTICCITTEEYTAPIPLYVDSRCLSICATSPPVRKINLPDSAMICKRMLDSIGVRYFWGGVYPQGVEYMKRLYPHHSLQNEDAQCVGVDCSGLLRYATEGFTPHSTTQLLNIGEEIDISQLDAQAVSYLAKPLDLIVWKGHVIVVIDRETVIESALGRGVFCSSLTQRLEEVREKAKIKGKQLSYRRWYPSSSKFCSA